MLEPAALLWRRFAVVAAVLREISGDNPPPAISAQ